MMEMMLLDVWHAICYVEKEPCAIWGVPGITKSI